jgi:hypothetical protein
MSKLIFEKGVKGSNSFSLPEAGLAQPDINQTLPPHIPAPSGSGFASNQ